MIANKESFVWMAGDCANEHAPSVRLQEI